MEMSNLIIKKKWSRRVPLLVGFIVAVVGTVEGSVVPGACGRSGWRVPTVGSMGDGVLSS
jgi:hypothetical protein